MKKLFKIFKTSNQKIDHNIDIDQIINNNNLNYEDINFNSEKIDILKSYNSLNQKLNNKSIKLKSSKFLIPHINYNLILKPIYTVVLTCIIIFSISKFKSYIKPIEYAEISVKKGEKITIHITENITAYLNSESTISIPLEIKRNSEILLNGEAYFEIHKENKIRVIANSLVLESKDGSFHVNTANQIVETNVTNGNVNFYNPQLPQSTEIILTKGEKATYNSLNNFIAVEKLNNKNYLAWHTGILEFNNQPLKSVINVISNYYEIPISIENKELSSLKYTAKFQNSEIDEILDIIQFTFNCNISTDVNKIVIN